MGAPGVWVRGVNVPLAPQERLYYVAIRGTPPASMCSRAHFFTIDNELVYWK